MALQALWKFDEGTGTTINDSSGNSNNGSISGASWISGNPVGPYALSFDGVNDYGSAAIDLSSYTSITAVFWMNAPAYDTNDGFAFEYTPDDNANNGFYFDPNTASGNIELAMRANPTGPTYKFSSITRPAANQWHQYAIVYQRTANAQSGFQAYIDGLPVTVTDVLTAAANGTSFANSTLYFGSRAGSSLFGNLKLDDFRIYDGTLSASDVHALYISEQISIGGGYATSA